jgi:hypothetical protein
MDEYESICEESLSLANIDSLTIEFSFRYSLYEKSDRSLTVRTLSGPTTDRVMKFLQSESKNNDNSLLKLCICVQNIPHYIIPDLICFVSTLKGIVDLTITEDLSDMVMAYKLNDIVKAMPNLNKLDVDDPFIIQGWDKGKRSNITELKIRNISDQERLKCFVRYVTSDNCNITKLYAGTSNDKIDGCCICENVGFIESLLIYEVNAWNIKLPCLSELMLDTNLISLCVNKAIHERSGSELCRFIKNLTRSNIENIGLILHDSLCDNDEWVDSFIPLVSYKKLDRPLEIDLQFDSKDRRIDQKRLQTFRYLINKNNENIRYSLLNWVRVSVVIYFYRVNRDSPCVHCIRSLVPTIIDLCCGDRDHCSIYSRVIIIDRFMSTKFAKNQIVPIQTNNKIKRKRSEST